MSNPNLEPKVRELLELRRLREELDAEITVTEGSVFALPVSCHSSTWQLMILGVEWEQPMKQIPQMAAWRCQLLFEDVGAVPYRR